jgi:hypothetical protein
MYELKRSTQIHEEVKLGDEVLHVDLDIDSMAKDFNKRYNNIIRAEQTIKDMQAQDSSELLESAQKDYGEAIISLLEIVFGAENAAKIVDFYESKFIEMSIEIFPFIIDVIAPQINKYFEAQKEKLAAQYKNSQASKFGLNRKQRRTMGMK